MCTKITDVNVCYWWYGVNFAKTGFHKRETVKWYERNERKSVKVDELDLRKQSQSVQIDQLNWGV